MSLFKKLPTLVQGNGSGKPRGPISKFFRRLILPIAAITCIGLAASCNDQTTTLTGPNYSDVITTDTLIIQTPPDSNKPDTLQRFSPIPGDILITIEGKERILQKGKPIIIPTGHKINIDYVNTDSSDITKVVADAKVTDSKDSLVLSLRDIKSGDKFQIPGTKDSVEFKDVDFENQDGSVDMTFLRKPRKGSENYRSNFAIIKDGDNSFEAYTEGFSTPNDEKVNAIVFIGHETGARRFSPNNGVYVYSVDTSQVYITSNVNAQVEAIDNYSGGTAYYTLELKEVITDSAGNVIPDSGRVSEAVVALDPLNSSSFVPFKMYPMSDTVNYSMEFKSNISSVHNMLVDGYPSATASGGYAYEPNCNLEAAAFEVEIKNPQASKIIPVYLRKTTNIPVRGSADGGSLIIDNDQFNKVTGIKAILNIESVK